MCDWECSRNDQQLLKWICAVSTWGQPSGAALQAGSTVFNPGSLTRTRSPPSAPRRALSISPALTPWGQSHPAPTAVGVPEPRQ